MGLLCGPADGRDGRQGAPSLPRTGTWGHVVARLLEEPSINATHLVEKAKVLDNFYVATRCANGHPGGAPFEHYGPLQGDEAIRHASEIIEFVRARLA